MLLSAGQVYKLARGVGLTHDAAITATAIAWAESGLETEAKGDVTLQDSTWGPSCGLWQVRSLKSQLGTGSVRDAASLFRPAFNARSMASISSHGRDWSPWSTYTSGKYRRHLKAVSRAVGDDPNPSAPPAGGVVASPARNDTGGWVDGIPDPGDLGVPSPGDVAGAVGSVLDLSFDQVRGLVLTAAVVSGGLLLVLVGAAVAARGVVTDG